MVVGGVLTPPVLNTPVYIYNIYTLLFTTNSSCLSQPIVMVTRSSLSSLTVDQFCFRTSPWEEKLFVFCLSRSVEGFLPITQTGDYRCDCRQFGELELQQRIRPCWLWHKESRIPADPRRSSARPGPAGWGLFSSGLFELMGSGFLWCFLLSGQQPWPRGRNVKDTVSLLGLFARLSFLWFVHVERLNSQWR